MTIPDSPTAAPSPAAADPADARVTRPEPERTGPIRSGFLPGGDGPAAPGAPPPADPDVGDAIADAVKTSYDVFTDNLKRGRMAAMRFGRGEYNVTEVPQDAAGTARQLIVLARQLSDTTFEICDRLVVEISGALQGQPQQPSAAPPDPPPFRPTPTGAPPSAAAPPPPPQPPPVAGLPLAVTFAGAAKGQVLVASLARPDAPTSPQEIKASALAPRDGTAAPITGVTFEADLASGGLTATITVPDGQAAGVYSGAVYAGTQPTPLGVLSIELAQ